MDLRTGLPIVLPIVCTLIALTGQGLGVSRQPGRIQERSEVTGPNQSNRYGETPIVAAVSAGDALY